MSNTPTRARTICERCQRVFFYSLTGFWMIKFGHPDELCDRCAFGTASPKVLSEAIRGRAYETKKKRRG